MPFNIKKYIFFFILCLRYFDVGHCYAQSSMTSAPRTVPINNNKRICTWSRAGFKHTQLESTDYTDSSQLDMAQREIKVLCVEGEKKNVALQTLFNFLPLHSIFACVILTPLPTNMPIIACTNFSPDSDSMEKKHTYPVAQTVSTGEFLHKGWVRSDFA